MQNDTASLGDTVSYKAKYGFTVQSSNNIPSYSNRFGNLWPHKNMYMYVYRSFAFNYQELGATKMPFKRWIDKKMVLHPNIADWNKLICKGWKLYNLMASGNGKTIVQ